MKNKTKFIATIMIVVSTALSCGAQEGMKKLKPPFLPFKNNRASLLKERKKSADFLPSSFYRPVTGIKKAPQSKDKLLPRASTDNTGNRKKVLPAPSNRELWANVTGDNLSGIYSFSPTRPVAFSRLSDYGYATFNGGAAIVDDKLHGIYYDTSYADMGFILVYHLAFDTESWELTTQPEQLEGYSMIAQETATDPVTGEVFGAFLKNDGTGYEWGVANYNTLTRTAIAPVENVYLALGIDSNQKAFGVAADGNLYCIDRVSGEEKLIGSTGLSLTAADGKVYPQSGEIDPKDNTFYWAATTGDGKTALYRVDLATATTTEVGSIGNGTSVLGMVVPKPKAEDGAPAEAQNLSATFTEGSTDGSISFTAPTHTFGGSPLTGTLTYTVYANDKELSAGEIQAGSSKSVTVSVEEGVNLFTVILGNEVGKSPKAKLSRYVGNDIPAKVTRLNAAADTDGKVTLTWNAPTATLHDGYLGKLTYDIIRISNHETTEVAKQITGQTFTEQLPLGELKGYVYAVRATNTSQTGEWKYSNSLVIGKALEPPFADNFDNEADAALYAVIDANEDEASWQWDKDDYTGQTVYRYHWSDTEDADDWLLLPPLELRQGKNYTLSFKVKNNGSDYTERFEVAYGTSPNIDAFSTRLIPPTDVRNEEFETITAVLTPTKDGVYHLAFHALSPAGGYYLNIDSLSLTTTADNRAPQAPTNLSGSFDPKGALQTSIGFVAPTKSIDGKPLTAISKIEVRNGIRRIRTFDNPMPGSKLEMVDNEATNGDNNYTITAFNEYGAGAQASLFIYVGQDIPAVPEVQAFDLSHAALLDWETVKGVNDGIIVPEDITYHIYNVSESGFLADKIGTATGGSTEFTVENLNTNEGNQRYIQWAVNAVNKAGASGYGVASMIVGKPYTLPFHNSLKDATLENQFLALEAPDDKVVWTATRQAASDNDGGCLVFAPAQAGTSTISTGKIAIEKGMKPKLIFDYQGKPSAPVKLEVSVCKKNFDDSRILFTRDFSTENNGNAEWKNVVVDIPDSHLDEDYVFVRFKATATGSLQQAPLFVDNINVADVKGKDLSVDMTVPANAKKGQTVAMDIHIKNKGVEDFTKARLTVTVNGSVFLEKEFTEGIRRLENITLPLTYQTTTLDEANALSVKAEINGEGDDTPDNDMAIRTVEMMTTELPTPENLVAVENDWKGVALQWSKPAEAVTTLTDGFELYEPWSTSFGSWKTIDIDKGNACPLSEQNRYTRQGEAFAFINWKPDDFFSSGQGLDPHSGSMALAAIYQVDMFNADYIDADNLLVSPELSGHAQTVSFWVNNVTGNGFGTESFDCMVSEGGTALKDFTKIGETYTQGSGKWTEIRVDVPEGTKYFAIRHVTKAADAFVFMLDDVTLEAGVQPLGYRIYRDRMLLGNTSETNFQDSKIPDGEHTYSVTAVFADGSESMPVQLAVVTDIRHTTLNADDDLDIFTTDGVKVGKGKASFNNLPQGVYVIRGRKVVVADREKH